jgi:ABC transport system ATP-binding/permease protein
VSGWLAERSSTPTAPSPKSSSPAPKPQATKAPSGPSPYTVGRQLRETEQAMVKAQKQVDRLTERLATVTDHQELTSLGTELTTAQAALDALESRWLELAELQQG